eukprot:GHVN01081026.1.p3 GENE.GHVN01081026.1~~GHVN01081026.1.p3  ORF type:complete len:239 (+),score=36.97 GHVN01081026.1:2820-3536(+)
MLVFEREKEVFKSKDLVIILKTEVFKSEENTFLQKTKRITKWRVSKKAAELIQERKCWKRFGSVDESNESAAMLGGEIRFGGQKTAEIKKKTNLICSHCQGEHYSFRCEMKVYAKDKETAMTSAEVEASSKKTGLYISPSMRAKNAGIEVKRNNKIKISNLPKDTCEEDIRMMCGSSKEISRVHLPMRSRFDENEVETKYFSGVSYVEFREEEAAKEALKRLDGRAFGDLLLKVEFAD